MSQSVQVVDFFIRFLHELNYFVRNPTKNNYFTFNRTGNAQFWCAYNFNPFKKLYLDALEWKLHQYRNKSLHGIFPSMFCPFVSQGYKSNNFDVTIARNIFQSSWHSKMASNTSQKHHKNQFLIGVIIWNEKNDFPALSRGDWSVGNLICWYFIRHDKDRLFYTFF